MRGVGSGGALPGVQVLLGTPMPTSVEDTTGLTSWFHRAPSFGLSLGEMPNRCYSPAVTSSLAPALVFMINLLHAEWSHSHLPSIRITSTGCRCFYPGLFCGPGESKIDVCHDLCVTADTCDKMHTK